MILPQHFYNGRKLDSLVENKTSYTLNNAEVHVYETHQQAERILLQFDQPVLTSMISGKKIMHLADKQSFAFLPGESLILPAFEPMCIDFPEAAERNPTNCLAMTISEEKILHTIQLMNECMPKVDQKEWDMIDYSYHFTNDGNLYGIIQRLLFLFGENHKMKDVFIDGMLQELVVRILQSNTRKVYSEQSYILGTNNRLAFIVDYIQKNLDQPLTIEDLSQKACMSQSHFHRVFKNELGISPTDFINNERIKLAGRLLKDSSRKVKEVYMACGFESRSYFNRVFKRKYKVSPKEFQAGNGWN